MRKVFRAGLLAVGVTGVLAVPARAADPDAVRRAVDRGVASLRGRLRADGVWVDGVAEREVGCTSLVGLTLLECGAGADDRAVAGAARHVRQHSIRCTYTYSLSLAILFLDRLGDPADVPLIESMAVRLLAAQGLDGGWRYNTPPPATEEVRRLEELVRDRARPGGEERRPVRGEAQDLRQLLTRVGPVDASQRNVPGDNSNTQFAVLALWVARRHGMPVHDALLRAGARFRAGQEPGGVWGYFDPVPPGLVVQEHQHASGSMTCAGVLGLALAQGALAEAAPGRDPKGRPRDAATDRAVARALAALGTAVSPPAGGAAPQAGGTSYYFLWSLARVCLALGLDTLDNKDWYAWGADVLLANQQADGSWKGDYELWGADTCFALQFLRKTNLARDLPAQVRSQLKTVTEIELKAVGGKRPAKPPLGGKSGIEPVNERSPSRLADDLLRAPVAEREALLHKLRDAKGVENTEALAFAIPRLEGAARRQAREALAARLTRLTAESLGKYLQDDEAEIRRAAALACARKGLADAVPKLIPLLRDRDAAVAQAAHAALKELTRQDLDADPAAWQAWWKKQGRE
jgi:hypothetical protein